MSTTSTVVFILGMHRSGTSLLASWLQSCGLFIGSDLYGQGIGNEKGHFEDWRFIKHHQLALGELPWYKPRPRHFDFDTSARQLIHQNDQLYAQWGWKDPRTCLFIDQWEALIPNAKAIVIYRHYNAVVDSMLRRRAKQQKARKNWLGRYWDDVRHWLFPGLFANEILASWILHNQKLLEYLKRNVAHSLVIEVEELTQIDKGLFEHLQAWGLNLTYVPVTRILDDKLLQQQPSISSNCSEELLKQAELVYKELQSLRSFRR